MICGPKNLFTDYEKGTPSQICLKPIAKKGKGNETGSLRITWLGSLI